MDSLNSSDVLPTYNERKIYRMWRREMELSCELSGLPVDKYALKIYSELTGTARDVASELDFEQLKSDDGLNILFRKLDSHFLRNKSHFQLKAYRELFNLWRPKGENIMPFIDLFEHKLSELTDEGIKLSDSVMAFQLLSASCVLDRELQLVLSTVEEVTYQAMKEALVIIFSSEGYKEGVRFDEISRSRGRGREKRTRENNQTGFDSAADVHRNSPNLSPDYSVNVQNKDIAQQNGEEKLLVLYML